MNFLFFPSPPLFSAAAAAGCGSDVAAEDIVSVYRYGVVGYRKDTKRRNKDE